MVGAAFGCSGASGGGGLFAGGSGSGSGSGSSSSGGVQGGSLTGDGGMGEVDDCSDQATNYVYLLSAENDLYSFAPDKKQMTEIGPLACKTVLQPNSMAVDRNAVAYVDYVAADDSIGAIFQVSTLDASCTGPILGLPGGWERVGMGYSTESAGSSAESLYVAGVGDDVGLGLVDFAKGTVDPIGRFTGALADQNAELTGTGDGRLFGFFTTDPVVVAQVDKTNGSTETPVPMNGVEVPADFAFSFWGGHFYLYTSEGEGVGNGSDVADYDPVSGTVDTSYMQGIGFDIVGAGVSTCAPVTAPQ